MVSCPSTRRRMKRLLSSWLMKIALKLLPYDIQLQPKLCKLSAIIPSLIWSTIAAHMPSGAMHRCGNVCSIRPWSWTGGGRHSLAASIDITVALFRSVCYSPNSPPRDTFCRRSGLCIIFGVGAGPVQPHRQWGVFLAQRRLGL